MAVVVSPSPSRRGFQTFKPPPQGCVGWGPRHEEPLAVIQDEIENSAQAEERQLATAEVPKVATQELLPTHLKIFKEEELQRKHYQDAVKAGAVPPLAASCFPLQDDDHYQAAVKADVEALSKRDEQLRVVLAADEGAFGEDAATKAAFELYRKSLLAFDPGPEVRRKAFRAVSQENVAELTWLFDSAGLEWDAQNAGKQTLLEVAVERERPTATAMIEAERERLKKENKS
eukprot:TRINITY_DN44175_c0_g1_i1.p1 TRINITY_DN44175_c0_g1~~TRINITY_DN44175_c0_g1_i1.p1  ORF type:complete len:231 (-),score=60.00 TRINITY_DN44175_c0_g1_i1:296-988(-)